VLDHIHPQSSHNDGCFLWIIEGAIDAALVREEDILVQVLAIHASVVSHGVTADI